MPSLSQTSLSINFKGIGRDLTVWGAHLQNWVKSKLLVRLQPKLLRVYFINSLKGYCSHVGESIDVWLKNQICRFLFPRPRRSPPSIWYPLVIHATSYITGLSYGHKIWATILVSSTKSWIQNRRSYASRQDKLSLRCA